MKLGFQRGSNPRIAAFSRERTERLKPNPKFCFAEEINSFARKTQVLNPYTMNTIVYKKCYGQIQDGKKSKKKNEMS